MAPSLRTLALLTRKELRDAWRNRWFLLYGTAFTVLALGLSWLGVTGVARTGFAGAGRTAGSLVNLVILVVPLMGITLGAQAIAADRERGSLLYLLAQPIDTLEVVLAKFLGLTAAVTAALLVGFGVTGMVMAGKGGFEQAAPFLGFLGFAVLLGAASVGLGLLISALSARASMAAGVALFVWLGLLLLGDLGLMGTALTMKLEIRHLLAAALVNPLQVFKLGALLVLRGGLEALGPAGLFAARTWGEQLVPLLASILAAWTLATVGGTAWVMQRKGGLE
ncbi:MAG TPA: ABC transporter permease [Thermoanaerobaculia bacterium]|nr:ABC transporter permease [Thermoanaerobaculia bacterium]